MFDKLNTLPKHVLKQWVFGSRDSIMLNAGFYLFDAETKASRFYPMLDNMNIHDLLLPISDG